MNTIVELLLIDTRLSWIQMRIFFCIRDGKKLKLEEVKNEKPKRKKRGR